MAKGERVSDQEQLELISSAEARDNRRQKKLGATAIPKLPLRGKQRVSAFEYRKPTQPEQLPFETAQALGRALVDQPILVDEITKYLNPKPNEDSIVTYVNGAVRRNQQTAVDLDDKREINKAKRRAFFHAADSLRRDTRTKKDDARISRAAIASVYVSITNGERINTSAAHYASAAIEDFGICLRQRTDLTDVIDHQRDLPTYFEQVGVYTVSDPEELRNHSFVLRLVQLEQVKREAHWGELNDAVAEAFNYKNTRHDIENNQKTEDLIASFAVNDEVQSIE